jgi:SWI/SNF-related matrix-associated actin-dependent regulator of chromatin subfamily A3
MAVSGRRSKVSTTVLHSIHELRLFCNNGKRKAVKESPESDDELLSMLQQHDANVCAQCNGPIFSIDQTGGDANVGLFIAKCKHLVCHSCHPQCYKSKRGCMLCAGGHVPKRPSDDSELALNRGDKFIPLVEHSAEEYPSKLLALLKDLQMDTGSKW